MMKNGVGSGNLFDEVARGDAAPGSSAGQPAPASSAGGLIFRRRAGREAQEGSTTLSYKESVTVDSALPLIVSGSLTVQPATPETEQD
jgi:hypothetical protein